MTDLRTTFEWEEHFGVEIIDPDGWRGRIKGFDHLKPKLMSEYITEEEFLIRSAISTISCRLDNINFHTKVQEAIRKK